MSGGKIDILDLVEIAITRLPPSSPLDRAPIGVDVVPYDKEKQLVFDDSALETMNNNITERIRHMQLDVRNPQSMMYIKEYVGRMISSLYKNGLVELEDIPDAEEDPYAKARKWTR